MKILIVIMVFVQSVLAQELVLKPENLSNIHVITDLDLTMKPELFSIENLSDLRNCVEPYLGMKEILKIFKLKNMEITLTSLNPNTYRELMKMWLKFVRIPYDNLLTQPVFGDQDVFQNKKKQINSILLNTSKRFIIIADKNEVDNQYIESLPDSHMRTFSAIYIRQKNYDDFARTEVFPFISAMDIALYEYQAHRFTQQDVEVIANIILRNPHLADRIVPSYAFCPLEEDQFPLKESFDIDMRTLYSQVKKVIISACKSRY